MKHGSIFAVAIVVVGVAAGSALVRTKAWTSEGKELKSSALLKWTGGKTIPPDGLVSTNSSDKGDIQNAVKDFKRIYAAVDAFRKKHKRLPDAGELLDFSKPLVEGFQLTKDDFDNPDRVYADHPPEAGSRTVYGITPAIGGYLEKGERRPGKIRRWDGTPASVFPENGVRDVWLVCDLYHRVRRVKYPDYSTKNWVHGHDIVLWSDGHIGVYPAKDMLLATADGKHFMRVWPGEPGVPKEVVPGYKHKENRLNTYYLEVGKP